MPKVRVLVENADHHFDGKRYALDEFVVASNHVHALVTPLGEHELSNILHSWKSFTAHEILKVEAAGRRLAAAQKPDSSVPCTAPATRTRPTKSKSRDGSSTINVWQKEGFDHIVRSPQSLGKFRGYIRAHKDVNQTSR